MDIAIIAVVGIGVYFLYSKFFSGGGSSQNNAQTASANQSAVTASNQQAAAQGIKATLTPNNMAAIANSVYTIGVGASDTADLMNINNQLVQVNNLADLNGIIQAFGTKNIPSGDITAWYNTCLSLGINCVSVGLGDFVRTLYGTYDPSGAYLSNLNEFFTNMGINYQF